MHCRPSTIPKKWFWKGFFDVFWTFERDTAILFKMLGYIQNRLTEINTPIKSYPKSCTPRFPKPPKRGFEKDFLTFSWLLKGIGTSFSKCKGISGIVRPSRRPQKKNHRDPTPGSPPNPAPCVLKGIGPYLEIQASFSKSEKKISHFFRATSTLPKYKIHRSMFYMGVS